MTLELNSLIGQTLPLYKVEKPYFWLGHHVFHAVENEDDGYRSSCECVIDVGDVTGTAEKKSIHSSQPLVWVKVEEQTHTRIDGWQLRDENGHIWIVVGTDNADDYYPAYEFIYSPPLKAQL